MTPDDLKSASQEPAQLSSPLRALWFAARGEWETAHKLVQDDDSVEAAWVHAYLHWEEGDDSNARYWYGRAGRPRHGTNLAGEWQHIASTLLEREG